MRTLQEILLDSINKETLEEKTLELPNVAYDWFDNLRPFIEGVKDDVVEELGIEDVSIGFKVDQPNCFGSYRRDNKRVYLNTMGPYLNQKGMDILTSIIVTVSHEVMHAWQHQIGYDFGSERNIPYIDRVSERLARSYSQVYLANHILEYIEFGYLFGESTEDIDDYAKVLKDWKDKTSDIIFKHSLVVSVLRREMIRSTRVAI